MRSEKKNMLVANNIDAVTTTAAASGAGVDTQGYESVAFIANVGESGDTLSGSVSIDLLVQESDDDSTYTDVAEADLDGGLSGGAAGAFALIDAAAEDDTAYTVGYIGGKRYVRSRIELTGTHTNGTPIGIVSVKSNPKYGPAA